MKVFVTGATGVLGKRVVRLLVERGHQVTGVVRSQRKAEQIAHLGATPVEMDLFDPERVSRALLCHDAVLNLATSIPPGSRSIWKSSWKMNHRLRREASLILSRAALAAGVERFVQESITLLYADGGDDWIDERHALAPTWITNSALVAERNALEFGREDRRGIVLRFATFYGPDSHHTVDAVAAARRGNAAGFGARRSFLSAITTDDAASATVAALDLPSGIYNIADDEPLRREDHFAALARAVGREQLRFLPAFAGRLLGPKMDMLLRSHRVSSHRFREATGWVPSTASMRQGWPRVVEAGDVALADY